ncbi:MAG: YadA-like family protein [Morganella sp. (in: enterobacteria)]
MKKSLLALIIAPIFVHAADTENKVTEVRFSSLYHDYPVRFLEKKSDGDRAAGVSELHQTIDYLGQNIRENNESLGELQGEITWNQRIAMDETSQLDDKITSIGGVVESTNQKINTFMADVTEKLVPEYVNSVLPGLVGDEVDYRVSAVLEKQIVPLDQRTESLEDKTQQLDTQLDITTRRSQHNNELIGTIPGMIEDGIKKEVNDYHLYMTTQIEPMKRQAIHTELAVLDVEKTIESAKVVTAIIMDATTSLEADVDALNTRVSNVSKKANLTNNVATGNRKDIDQHATKIEKNALDMLKNRQDLRGLENDLRETNERLDNGLAANAALNGLFQPYGIGKLNITAAMGGYNSTQAVAVGTGYRFNENIAMKTGVSYTGSNDVMYNMAVNLEW